MEFIIKHWLFLTNYSCVYMTIDFVSEMKNINKQANIIKNGLFWITENTCLLIFIKILWLDVDIRHSF